MNVPETIRFLETGNDIDAQLKAFDEMKASVTGKDLPVLLVALQSKSSNFFVRELLAEPIINLAGAHAIPELMTALQKNFEEGHDNDGFQLFLTELAEEDPEGVKAALEQLKHSATKAELENIEWLLEYCQ